MDEYQHPLFFEAKTLTSKEKEKICIYFQKKRDSGGGECGKLEKVGDDLYQICFKDKEVQETVLKRKQHILHLPGRELHLTVSNTTSLHNPESKDQATSDSQTFTKTKKSLEKIFKLDIYLLYYLRDNLTANKILQKQLSSIGCTVEFNFDEEEAVVRGDIEKGPGRGFNAADKWEFQVDRVIIDLTDRYICHHVLEPKQIRILLQDSSFTTDDIKVYTESGYPVVVGEAEAVKEKIKILEKSLSTRKELPIVNKQLELVKEEFVREMHAHHPEVKILISNTEVILEGPNKDVQSGATKLDELMKKVIQKRLKLSTDLITFIKSTGVVCKYQTRFQQSLRNPVALDVGSDLVLCSLSSGALDEAEAAILRDLSVTTVQLQGAAAVSPDLDNLKGILTKAKNAANSREVRVDVSFIPAISGTTQTTVQIVGYSDNVNKLKEVLQDYQINQVGTQELLNLPHPELVDCFDKFLDLIGLKQTNVSFKTSNFPYDCVLVSGPRCQVQKVQADLNKSLASLIFDTLVLDGPVAQRYFQEKGEKDKERVESTCRVFIKEQEQGNSQSTTVASNLSSGPQYSNILSFSKPNTSATRWQHNTTSNTSNMTTVPVNKPNLHIKVGSVEDEQVNVLVAPMINRKLTSTKIGKCLLRKAGDTMQKQFDLMAAKGTPSPGDIMQVNSPPSLGCSKIFFIECLPWDGVRGTSMKILSYGLKKCLDLCVQQGWISVAFPVIGPGVALKYPMKEATQVLTDQIHQFGLLASSRTLSTIHVVITPDYPDSEECYLDVYRNLSLNLNQGSQVIFRSLTSDLDMITMTMGGGVRLQVVFGDITSETTDAIVNTTDFVNFDTNVCKDILTLAGPHVKANLSKAKVNRADVFQTSPGSFPCKAILHVCGEKDGGIIEQLVCRIIQRCESCQFKSVAIPAICAGTGGLDPSAVACAILRGLKSTMSSSNLHCLTNIRLILIKINVFLAFKKEAEWLFPNATTHTGSVSPVAHAPQPASPPMNVDLSFLCTSSTVQQSVFMVMGLCRKDVDDALRMLKTLYQTQCSTQTFRKDNLAGITQAEAKSLKQLVEILGVNVEEDQFNQGTLTVSGLKDGVDQMMQMIKNFVR